MRLLAFCGAAVAAAAVLASSGWAAGETITIGIASSALDSGGTTPGFTAADLDPAMSFVTQSWQLQYITCAKLYNYSDEAAPQGNVLEPEAATALPIVSNAGLTYTFTIRPGLGFSSPAGEEVTAASFERAIQRLKTPAIGSGGRGIRG